MFRWLIFVVCIAVLLRVLLCFRNLPYSLPIVASFWGMLLYFLCGLSRGTSCLLLQVWGICCNVCMFVVRLLGLYCL